VFNFEKLAIAKIKYFSIKKRSTSTLPNSITTAQVCDATKADSSNAADLIKIILQNLRL